MNSTISKNEYVKLRQLVRRAGFDLREEVGHYGDDAEYARQVVADVRETNYLDVVKVETAAGVRYYHAMVAEGWPDHDETPTAEDGLDWCLGKAAADLEYALQCTSAMFWHAPKPVRQN